MLITTWSKLSKSSEVFVSTSGFLVLILVGIAAIFFITERLRADLVALLPILGGL